MMKRSKSSSRVAAKTICLPPGDQAGARTSSARWSAAASGPTLQASRPPRLVSVAPRVAPESYLIAVR